MIKRKNKDSTKPVSEINVVPYIDVMLVLLVIFMITAPMLTQGITVDLPKAASQSLKTTEREPIIVSVNQQGSLFLNISSTPSIPIDAQSLAVRVAAELSLARESQQKLNVLVKGDRSVPYGKIVEAMSLLKKAGAEQVGLLTDSYSDTGVNKS
ncbi:protein TolR [Legionella israelensis]|uniref:Tol-Pal system protein TolR n=1 Tax=Legionella israelensis TaxID=454 RepID=A0A0W0V499_9GAMM|nr:protein TolR [Legionella israelensis]KTD14717.1 membrane spanning protein in TolA-TolQ-TolR complex [Legionella israelensis]QBS10966.1 protein TolR [Legionella israelensis]SCY30448.1 Cell division and transport-associated protein TolR (TC 2.C.1.2.1) [Legionella israelensis DSM 19235]STX57960.1 membrane spanning protein in TolA-TolQ-TolR complex [Legionella israelensis]